MVHADNVVPVVIASDIGNIVSFVRHYILGDN